MRVVGGSAKGRALKSVPGESTRPILDRVKVALFDILRPTLPGMRMLDLFAGTGSVGIEALSQGAEHCVFLDLSDKAIKVLRDNLETTDLAARAEVRHADAFTYLRMSQRSFDLIYIAPPQYKGLWLEAMRTIAERPNLLAENGIVIVQIDPTEYEPLELQLMSEIKQRKYGKTLLVWYEAAGRT